MLNTHYAVNPYPVDCSPGKGKALLKLTIVLFLLTCIFDPADQLLGLKLPLFLSCCVVGVFVCLLNHGKIKIPGGLILYVALMIIIPGLSIAYYFLMGGSGAYEGFQLYKAYVFISFAIILYINNINILKSLSVVLSFLALAIIVVYFIILMEPSLYMPLKLLGEDDGIFILDKRSYGADLVMLQIYFVTSPMLVVPIAYYFHLARSSEKKIVYWLIVFINIFAMFIAGTRNNMVVSFMLPLALCMFYAKNKLLIPFLMFVIAIVVGLAFHREIGIFLDPSEVSNSIKLMLVKDYMRIFSNPVDLLFGQGLGSYYFWTGKGEYFYITELTYFEVIRNFGLLCGGVILMLLVCPIVYAFFLNRNYSEKHVIVAYLFYLIMCFSNPNLFSSLGMLILAVIIANIYISKKRVILR